MSALEDHVEAPRRGRPPRAEETQQRRRRRREGSLDLTGMLKLDCDAGHLRDLDKFVYRWVNDENGRYHAIRRYDDYDPVPANEVEGAFDEQEAREESSETVRRCVGVQRTGQPLYAYLVRKRRDYWQEDYEEMVAEREEMLSGTLRGDKVLTAEGAVADKEPNTYAVAGNQIGRVRRKAA